MTTYLTSDTHFGHVNIIKYCGRPFTDVDDMTKEMTNRWNSVVKDSDTVYHLGDFALGPKWKWPEYRAQLNGRIIFIVGNHDLQDPRAANVVTHPQFDSMLLPGDVWETHIDVPLDMGNIVMAHVPPVEAYSDGRIMPTALQHGAPKDTNTVLLCGHVHNAWRARPEFNLINVGVDVWDFTPQALEVLLEALK